MGARRSTVPPPAPAPAQDELPRTLTFALPAADRAAVLRVLRRYSTDRAEALRLALGLGTEPGKKVRG